MSDLAPQADVPSFERVRDTIERRYSQAMGVAEIGSSTIEVRAINVERATLDAEAAHVLADLRLSLNDAGSTPPAVG